MVSDYVGCGISCLLGTVCEESESLRRLVHAVLRDPILGQLNDNASSIV